LLPLGEDGAASSDFSKSPLSVIDHGLVP
jgi:hypothetical protein